MNKNLQALLLGYILFDVNGKKFLTYEKARTHRLSIKGNVCFKGFSLFRPFKFWRSFYIRAVHPKLEVKAKK